MSTHRVLTSALCEGGSEISGFIGLKSYWQTSVEALSLQKSMLEDVNDVMRNLPHGHI